MNSSKGMNSLNFVNVKKKGKDAAVKRGQTTGVASGKFVSVAIASNKSQKIASNIRSRAAAKLAAGDPPVDPGDFASLGRENETSSAKRFSDAGGVSDDGLFGRRRSSDGVPMDWTSPSVDQMMANLMQSLKQLAPLPGDEGWHTPECSPLARRPHTLAEGVEDDVDPPTPPVEMATTPGSSQAPSRTSSNQGNSKAAGMGKAQTIFEFVESSEEVEPGVMLRKMSGMLRIEPGAGGWAGREATIKGTSTTSTNQTEQKPGPLQPFPGAGGQEGERKSAFGAMERSLSREQLLGFNSNSKMGIFRSESAPQGNAHQHGSDLAQFHGGGLASQNAGAGRGGESGGQGDRAPKFDPSLGPVESQLAAVQETLLQARRELVTLQCDNNVLEKQLAELRSEAGNSKSPLPELSFDEEGNLAGSEEYSPKPQDSPETLEWVSILEKQVSRYRTDYLNMEKQRDDARADHVAAKMETEEVRADLEKRLLQVQHDLILRETEWKEKLAEDAMKEEEEVRKETEFKEEKLHTNAFLEAREDKMRRLEEKIAALQDGEEMNNMIQELSQANFKVDELERELGPLKELRIALESQVGLLKTEIETSREKYVELETRWQATQDVAEKASAQAEALSTKKSQLMMKTAVAFTSLETMKKKLGEEQLQRQLSAQEAESYQMRNERADLRKLEAEEQNNKLWAENLSHLHRIEHLEKQLQILQEFVQDASTIKDAETERRLEAVRQAIMDHDKLFEHEMVELCKENNTLFLRLLDIKMKFSPLFDKIPDVATRQALREILEQATNDLEEVIPEAEARYEKKSDKAFSRAASKAESEKEFSRSSSKQGAADSPISRTSSKEGFARRKSVASESEGGAPSRHPKVTHMRRYIFFVKPEDEDEATLLPKPQRLASTESSGKKGKGGRRRASVSSPNKLPKGAMESVVPNSGSHTDYLTTDTFRIGYFHVYVPARDTRKGKVGDIKLLKKPTTRFVFEDFSAPEEAFLPPKKGSKQEGNPRKLEDSIDVRAVLEWLAEVDPYGKEDMSAMFVLAKEVITRSFKTLKAIDEAEGEFVNKDKELEACKEELKQQQAQLSALQQSMSFLQMDQEGKLSDVEQMKQRIAEQDAERIQQQADYQSMLDEKNKEVVDALARSQSSTDEAQNRSPRGDAEHVSTPKESHPAQPPHQTSNATQLHPDLQRPSKPFIAMTSREVQTESAPGAIEPRQQGVARQHSESGTSGTEETLKALWSALDESLGAQRQLEQELQDVHRKELAAIRHMAEKLEASANELARIKAGGAVNASAIDALGLNIAEQVEELLAEQIMIEDAVQNREESMDNVRGRLRDVQDRLRAASVEMGHEAMAHRDPTATSQRGQLRREGVEERPRAESNATRGVENTASRRGAPSSELTGWHEEAHSALSSDHFQISLKMGSPIAAVATEVKGRNSDECQMCGAIVRSPKVRVDDAAVVQPQSPDNTSVRPPENSTTRVRLSDNSTTTVRPPDATMVRPPGRGRPEASGALNDSAEAAEELMRDWNIDSDGFLPQWMKPADAKEESDDGLDSSFLSKQSGEDLDSDDKNVPYPMRQQHPSRTRARIGALTKDTNFIAARVRLFDEHQEVRIRYLTEQLHQAFQKIHDLEMTLNRHEKRKKAVVKLAIARGRELERKKMAGEPRPAEIQELPNIPSEQWPPSRLAFRSSSASPTMQLPSLTDRKPKTVGGEAGFAQFKKAFREQEAKERLLRAERSHTADQLPGVKAYRPDKLSRDLGAKEKAPRQRKKSAPGPLLVSPWRDESASPDRMQPLSQSANQELLGAILQQELFNKTSFDGHADPDNTPESWFAEPSSFSPRAMTTQPITDLHPIYEDAASWVDEDT